MLLGKDIKLPYSSTQKHTTLQTDASIKGVGAVLIQYWIPVYFASWTLTPTERNNQNVQHKTLATIWGMECFGDFLFGEEFTLETDQKPTGDNLQEDRWHSPRITKLIYHSLVFRPFMFIYLKGKKNCYADALSRVSPMLSRRREEDTDIIMVNKPTGIVPIPVND